MLNAAIVGLGRWGRRLVDSVMEAGAPRGDVIRVTRAVTRTPENARGFLDGHRLAATSHYEDALADPDVGAILIATPHTLHANQAVAAAAAGKHVFVEKPFTLDGASAARVVAACESAGVVLAVGHNRRFLPAMTDFKALIDGGELGRILHAEGNFSGSVGLDLAADNWRANRVESPGGGMTAMGIHAVDALIHLLGPIAAVRCQSARQVIEIDIDDTTSMLFRFESGVTGYLGTLAATRRCWRVQVFGTVAWAEMRGPRLLDVSTVDEQVETRRYDSFGVERAELEAFARAAGDGPAYPVSPDEAVHGVAVMEAVIASARRDGSSVPIARFDGPSIPS